MKRTIFFASLLLALGAGLSHAQVYVYTSGHADIGVEYDAGEFEPHWHFHTGAVVGGSTLPSEEEFAPDEIVAYAPSSQEFSRPAGSQWDFTGTAAGGSLWILPQTSAAGVPFLGFAAEELNPLDWSSPITFTLVDFSAPAGGQFSFWQTDGFGTPIAYMSTVDGLSGGDAFSLSAGGHEHGNFGFTAPGWYTLTIEFSGTHVTDGLVTGEGTFSFQVVPEPSSAALLGVAGAGFLLLRRRHAQV